MYKRIKKDTKWTIKEIGPFNILNIKSEVSMFLNEWALDTSRQNIGMTHKHTEMFRLCETDYLWIPGTPINTIQVNSFKNVESNKEKEVIFDKIQNIYSGKILRCEIIKLKAHSEVYRHTDGGALLHYSRRIHIPLITDEKITFTVLNNTINMKEGVGYEINNQLPHSVSNQSNIDRIHMIVDVMPDDMINYRIIDKDKEF